MTINDILLLTNNKKINDDVIINNIVMDSRIVEKNDLFIAIKGNNYDGVDFIDEALSKGAIACVCTKALNDKCIVIENINNFLFKLGNYIRNKYNIPLIAITGSNGKTTTKELIYHILSPNYNILKSEGNNNNIIGISKTLFKLNSNYDLILVEFGTNHIGEITTLSKMCMPSMSVITNIGTSHLEYFKSLKNTYKEKLSIKDGMINDNVIVNGDDKFLKKLKYYKCGTNKRNDLVAYDLKSYLDKIKFKIKLDKEYEIVFNNPGIHFVNDILLAIKVSLDYGININTIIDRIKTYKLFENRMNMIKYNNNYYINDCYNSSYESIIAGINYMKNIEGKKIFIIGDILELGNHSIKIHKKINKFLSKVKNKKVFTVGFYSRYIDGINFNRVEDFINYIDFNIFNDCYIYIKGSRKINLDKILQEKML